MMIKINNFTIPETAKKYEQTDAFKSLGQAVSSTTIGNNGQIDVVSFYVEEPDGRYDDDPGLIEIMFVGDHAERAAGELIDELKHNNNINWINNDVVYIDKSINEVVRSESRDTFSKQREFNTPQYAWENGD